MNDAIALLAISQLVCLAGIAYLYAQLQSLRRGVGRSLRSASSRVSPMDAPVKVAARHASQQAARRAYGAAPGPLPARPKLDSAAVAARMNELGLDIPALARRMRRSEEEVRLLLRHQGVVR